MSQSEQKPNRAARRQAARDMRRAMKAGVGVDVRLAGYRVLRPDGSVKLTVGRIPAGKVARNGS